MPFMIGPPKNFYAEMGSYLFAKVMREWEEEQRRREAEPEEMSPLKGALQGALAGASMGGGFGGAVSGAAIGEGAVQGAQTAASMGGNFGGLWGMIAGAVSGAAIGYAGAEHGGTFADATQGAARTQGAMQIAGAVGQAWAAQSRKRKFNQLISELPEERRKLLQATQHDPALFGRVFGDILQQQASKNRIAAQVDKELTTKYGVTLAEVRQSADQKGISLRDELSYLSTTQASSEQRAKSAVEMQIAAQQQLTKDRIASGEWVRDVSEAGKKVNVGLRTEIDLVEADPNLDWRTKQEAITELSQQMVKPRLRLRDKQTEKTPEERLDGDTTIVPGEGRYGWDRSGAARFLHELASTPAEQWDEAKSEHYDMLTKEDPGMSLEEAYDRAVDHTNVKFGLRAGMGEGGRAILMEEEMRRRQPGGRRGPSMTPSPGAGDMASFIDDWKRGGTGAQAPAAVPAAPLPPDMIPEHKPRSIIPRLVSSSAEHLRSLSLEVNNADPKTWTEYQVNKAMPAVTRRLKELHDRKKRGMAPFTKADVKELAWLQSIKNRAPHWNRR